MPRTRCGSCGAPRKPAKIGCRVCAPQDLKLYPAQHIDLGSESEAALRALADFEVAAGRLPRGVEIYQDLLDRVLAAKPEAESNLTEATHLSRLYGSSARLQRRTGQTDSASALDGRRSTLWQHWAGALPNNPFVLRQLEGAGQ